MGILPESIRRFRLDSLFVRILAFFLLTVACSTLVVGFVSSSHSSGVLTDVASEYKGLLLDQARDILDKELETLDRITFMVALEDGVNRILQAPDADVPSDSLLYPQIIAFLNRHKQSNPVIESLRIEFFEKDLILSDESKYSTALYRSIYRDRAPLDRAWLSARHARFLSLGPATGDASPAGPVLRFARTFPVDEDKARGVVVVEARLDTSYEAIRRMDGRNRSVTWILDAEGHLVFGGGDRALLDRVLPAGAAPEDPPEPPMGSRRVVVGGRRYLLVTARSEHNGWRFLSLIPVDSIEAQTAGIRRFTVAVTLLLLAFGFLVSYAIAMRAYRPIQRLLGFLDVIRPDEGGSPGKGSEIDFIDRIVKYVWVEKEALRGSIEKSLPALRERFLLRLLEGSSPRAAFREVAASLELDMPHDGFQALAIELQERPAGVDASEACAFIDGLARRRFGGGDPEGPSRGLVARAVDRGGNLVVCVVNLPHDSPTPEIVFDFATAVRDGLRDMGLPATVGIGRAYPDPGGTAVSYGEALGALKGKIVRGIGSVIHCDEMAHREPAAFDYSLETESRIMNMVKTGAGEALARALEEVFRAHERSMQAGPDIVDTVCNALSCTAVRAMHDIQGSPSEPFATARGLMEGLAARQTLERKKEYLFGVFASLCDWAKGRRETQNQRTCDRIRRYVEDNCGGVVSLVHASERLGLSPEYISRVFKETSGVYFVDYVNSCRVGRARALLEAGDLPVAEVARRVGYVSTNTFIRAFKRIEGITPGAYKESPGRRDAGSRPDVPAAPGGSRRGWTA